MFFGKLKPILMVGPVIFALARPVSGQAICNDPWGTLSLTTSGYYGIPPTAFAVEDIVGVQMSLRNRGFYSGDFNGMMTMETIDAVQRFQAANYLPATGVLDARTQMALGVTIKGTATTTSAY